MNVNGMSTVRSWGIKVWYFCYFMQFAAVLPYLFVYFSVKGLSIDQVGQISSVGTWVFIPAYFIVPVLADRLDAHRAFLLLSVVGTIGCRLALMAVDSFAGYMGLFVAQAFLGAPVLPLASAMIVGREAKDGNFGFFYCWGALGYAAFSTPAGFIIQDLGFTAGFIANAILASLCIITCYAFPSVPKHEPAALPASGGSGIDPEQRAGQREAWQQQEGSSSDKDMHGASSGSIQSHVSSDKCDSKLNALSEEGDSPAGKPVTPSAGTEPLCGVPAPHWMERWVALVHTLLTPRVFLYIWNCTWQGFAYGIYTTYAYLLLQAMGGGTAVMGVSGTVSALAEVLFYICLTTVLQFLTADTLNHVCFILGTVRFVLFALLPGWSSPWIGLPLHALNGIAHPCGLAGIVIQAKRLAPPGWVATLQGVGYLFSFGVGPGMGSILGAKFWKNQGMENCFYISAGMLAGGWLAYLIGSLILDLLEGTESTDTGFDVSRAVLRSVKAVQRHLVRALPREAST